MNNLSHQNHISINEIDGYDQIDEVKARDAMALIQIWNQCTVKPVT